MNNTLESMFPSNQRNTENKTYTFLCFPLKREHWEGISMEKREEENN